VHPDCVDPAAAAVARRIVQHAERYDLALGGGTACALHLGHRLSRDLDFFALKALDPPGLLRDLAGIGEQRLRGISSRELTLVLDGVEISATSLGRAPLAPTDSWDGISVLALLDLAALKVEAAVRRGMARDLCDLHLLCVAGADLESAIRASSIDLVPALEALSDADRYAGQPELALRKPWHVGGATDYFLAQARVLLG